MHSRRVVELSESLGIACKLSSDDIVQLKISACLHDIGKIGIPDEILLKPGSLDASEWKVMQSHAEKGEDIVRNIMVDGSDRVASAIRHHHEFFNGNGYPDQIHGEHIPEFSRIISIADSFDAMTDVRPYHQTRNHIQVMDIMHGEHGKFDPWMLAKFETIISRTA